MNADKIPDIIIGRLPIYLRALQRMSEKGMKTTSSQELGEHVGISAAQIRKDISQFGEFGKQGTGYSIPFLMDKLREILKVNRMWDVAIGRRGRYRTCSGPLFGVCEPRLPCLHDLRRGRRPRSERRSASSLSKMHPRWLNA